MSNETLNTIGKFATLVIAAYGFFHALDWLVTYMRKVIGKDQMQKELEKCKAELREELEKCETKLNDHAMLLHRDKEHFDRVDSDIDKMKSNFIELQKRSDVQFSIIAESMLGMVSFLESNDKSDLKDAKSKLTGYLTKN